MKTSEIIYRILGQIKSGQLSDDFSLSEDLVFSQICSVRSRLIRQEKSANKWLSGLYIQDLPLVELVKADAHERCPEEIDECVLRSKEPLPKFVDTSFSDLVTFVGTVSGERFERTTYNSYKYMSHSRYTGHKTKFYFVGDYLYIIQPKTNLLKFVSVQGVFENPLEAESYQKCGSIGCYLDYDFIFPLSATLVDTLIQLVITEIRGSRILPPDVTNDSKDN
jgi:hypothetical protein